MEDLTREKVQKRNQHFDRRILAVSLTTGMLAVSAFLAVVFTW